MNKTRRCASTFKGRSCERDDPPHFAPDEPDRLHMAGPPGTPERLMWSTREADEHHDDQVLTGGKCIGLLPCRHIAEAGAPECGEPARIYDDGDPTFTARFGIHDDPWWRGECDRGHVTRYWPKRYRHHLQQAPTPSTASSRTNRRGCSVEGCPNERVRLCGEHGVLWPCQSSDAAARCWRLRGGDCAEHAARRAQRDRELHRYSRPKKTACERCGGPWKKGRCATCEACSWCGRADVRASGSPPRCDVCFEIERIGLAVAYLCAACGEDLDEDAIPSDFEPRHDALEGHAVDTLIYRCPHCGEDAVCAVDVTDLSHLPEPPESEWRLLAELLAEAA